MRGEATFPSEVSPMQCQHTPECPSAIDCDARAAHVVSDHWEQGWALLCNGLVVFDDGGVMLPAMSAA
jgi:hypothetical protein